MSSNTISSRKMTSQTQWIDEDSAEYGACPLEDASLQAQLRVRVPSKSGADVDVLSEARRLMRMEHRVGQPMDTSCRR